MMLGEVVRVNACGHLLRKQRLHPASLEVKPL